MQVKPLFDRVLIKPKKENETKSGIVLPETAKTRPDMGKVVAVADGVNLDGNKCDMMVKVGDLVLFNKYAGADIKIDGEDHIILRQIDIIGVVNE